MASLSTGQRNAVSSALDQYNGGALELRSGAAPGPDAADAGTLIASVPLPADAFTGPSSGQLVLSGTWQDPAADNGGTVAHFRLKASGDTGTASSTAKRIEGSVTLTGGGGDLQLDNTNVTAGQVINITAFSITVPA